MAGSPLTISLRVVGLEQAKADLKDFGTIGKRSFEEIEAEAKKLTAETTTTDKAMSGLANRMRRLAAETDPLAASNIKLRGTLVDIEKAVKAEIVSLELAATMTAHVKRGHEEFADQLVKTASAAAFAATNIGALTAKFDPATASAQQMGRELAELNQAFRAGVTIAGGYQNAWDGIIAKYDEGAQAARRAAAAQKELIAEARAAQNAVTAQHTFNTILGVDRQASGAARASAEAFEEAFRQQEQAANAAQEAQQKLVAMARQYAETIERARADQNALNAQQAFTQRLATPVSSGRSAGSVVNLNPATGAAAASASVFEEAIRNQERLAASATKFKNALNPLLPVLAAYNAELAEINAVAKAGLISEAERIQLTQRATTAIDEHGKVAQVSSQKVVVSQAQVRFAVQNLGFQLQDVATQLASGTSPLTVLIQQGGQFQQAFSAGGGVGNTIKAFASSVASMITPVTVAATAILALGAAFAVLVNRAFQNSEQIRRFDLILAGFNATASQTAEGMQKIARGLQAQGLSADDANKALEALGRNRLLNPAAMAQIAQSGLDLAARLGIKDVEGINKWTTAVEGGIDAIIKLGIQTNTLSTADAVSARRMADQGKQLEARNLALGKMQAALQGAHDAVLTPTAKAINSIGEAWTKMLDEFSKLGPIQNAKDALVNMLLGIANAASGTNADGTPAGPVKAIPGTNLQTSAPGYIPGSTGVAENFIRDLWGWIKGNPNPPVSYAGPPGDMRVTTYGYGSAIRAPASAGIGAVDPRILEVFALTQQLTGIAAQVTPHGGTTGSHVAGSQHYPRNTLTGYGEALDFNVADSSGRMILASEAAPGTKGRDLYEYFANYMKGLLQQGYGVGRSALDFRTGPHVGHVDALGMPPMGGATATGTGAISLGGARPTTTPGGLGVSSDLLGPGGIVPTFIPGGSTQAAADAEAVAKAEVAIQRYTQATGENLAVKKLWGTEERIATAILEARRAALADGMETEKANSMAVAAGARTAAELGIEIQKNTVIQTTQTQSYLAVAEALKINEAEANKVTAAYQAQQEVLSGKIRVEDKAVRTQQILAEQAAKNAIELQRGVNANDRRIETLQLENQLSGATSETIAKQIALLQAKQKLQEMGVSLTSTEGQNYLKSAEALAKAVEQHSLIAREQQKQDDMWRKIGGTIESAIGDVIDGIFDPKKTMDWGKMVKSMMQGLIKDLAMSQFVRPMIGSVLGTFGASQNVVQGFGGIGGSSGGINVSLGGGGLFGGGGLLKELGIDTGGGGLFSGTSGFLNKSLGGVFGTQQSGWIEGAGGIWTNAATGATTDIAGVSNITPGLLGNTTLGSAIGGVGLGFMGGTMLNSLLGGNQKTGMVGSGVGGLAGMALGSMIGMPMIGGLLGGLFGGGLGGMFGNNKPSNASAGANIDLSQFRITSGFGGGDPKIDQQVAQMGQSLQGFLDLLKTTGGALSGNVLLQSGVNTGITVDSSLAGYSGRFDLGKDSEAAIKVIEQALVKSITGVSETMTTVLSQVGTDEDIAKAISFAKAYENIKTAADGAFSEVEDASKKMGPFRIAMDQINALFADLTVSADRFGLALDPINAALAEATERLQGDFLDAIEAATKEASGSGFVNQIQEVLDNYVASAVEAAAIGLTDQATGDKLGTLFMEQVGNILEGLDDAQLNEVIVAFQGFNQVITDMAVSAQISNDAVADLAATAEELAQRVAAANDQIQSYIDQITATASAGVSPESAYLASQAQFQEQLQAAQGGDVEALESITEYADRYIQALEGYFGSSAEGVAEFNRVVGELTGLTTQTVGPHVDPAVETNTLLTTLNATVGTTSDEQVAAVSASTLSLQQANADAAAAIIAQNLLDLETITGVTTKTAEDNILANTENTSALIQQATDDSAALLLDSAEKTAALVEANDLNAEALIEKNLENAAALIDEAKLRTDEIIADNQLATENLIARAEESTAALLDQAGSDAALIIEAIALWAPAIVQAVTDGAASINLGIANWVGTQIGNDTSLANSAIESDTGLANSIVTAIGNAAATVVGGLDIWIGKNMENEKDLINSTINTDLTYTNAIIGGQVTAANSIIAADLTYTNSILAELDTNGTNTYNWLESINKWSKGIYDCCVFYGDKAVTQRQDILNKLQSIDNNIRQFLNMPPVYGGV